MSPMRGRIGPRRRRRRPQSASTTFPPCADRGASAEHFRELLKRGVPISRYPNLRTGLPAKRALLQSWTEHRLA